jgi:hypothetical protein
MRVDNGYCLLCECSDWLWFYKKEEIKMDVLNKVLDMMARWSNEGQGIFILLMVLLAMGFSYNVFKLIIVFFRGWPEEKRKCHHHGENHAPKTQ